DDQFGGRHDGWRATCQDHHRHLHAKALGELGCGGRRLARLHDPCAARLEPAHGETQSDLMRNPWTAWLDAATLVVKARSVVAFRRSVPAAGGPRATSEAQRMSAEKGVAAAEAQLAAGMALASGRGAEAAKRAAIRPYRRAVNANHRRLTKGRRKSSG